MQEASQDILELEEEQPEICELPKSEASVAKRPRVVVDLGQDSEKEPEEDSEGDPEKLTE